jgi:hypothetical protein
MVRVRVVWKRQAALDGESSVNCAARLPGVGACWMRGWGGNGDPANYRISNLLLGRMAVAWRQCNHALCNASMHTKSRSVCRRGA